MPNSKAREEEYQKLFYEKLFTRKINKKNLKHYIEQRGKKIFSNITIGENCNVLDIGCGEGIFSDYLIKNIRGSKVTGLDISFNRCVSGKERAKECNFLKGSADNLPFKSKQFDLVFCNALLHHVPNIKKTLDEILRTAKPSGYLALIEPNRFNPLICMLGFFVKAERGSLLLSIRQIIKYLKYNSVKVNVYPLNSYIYPYRKFPPNPLRKILEILENIFELHFISTHYVVICKIEN